MGTTNTPSKGNSPAQSGQGQRGQGQTGQGQTKPQQNPSPGQQQKPRDGNPSTDKESNRSLKGGGDDNIEAIGQGEDALGGDESDDASNKSPGASDRNRSDNNRMVR
jgi:hypothetical protein